MNMKLDNRFSY